MAKHYSTRDFFRNTPNKLLARYFAERGVLQQLICCQRKFLPVPNIAQICAKYRARLQIPRLSGMDRLPPGWTARMVSMPGKRLRPARGDSVWRDDLCLSSLPPAGV